jgi:hypothetical protein
MTAETDITPKPYRLAAGDGLADVWWKTGRMTVKAGSVAAADERRGTASLLRLGPGRNVRVQLRSVRPNCAPADVDLRCVRSALQCHLAACDSRQRIRAATAVVTERLALCRRCD